MRHTVKVLSYIFISSIVTSLVFAGDKKTEEEILKIKQIEQRKHDLEQGEMDLLPPGLEIDQPGGPEEKNLFLRATSKPYSGFLGTVVTPKQKQYPEGTEGAVMELLDNWDNIPPEDMSKAQEKLTTLLSSMSYEELRDIYEYNAHTQVESALYQSWLTTQRSGQPGIGLSRSTGAESEPNNNKSSANALSADTTLGYITAYDEDWYSITVNSGSDWVIETHASSASDNVGDTKLYLYSDTSSTNHIASDDNGGTGSYSKISHRFDNVAAIPTNLFFSEYAEGSSNNKYLEIYNGTGAAVDLSAYSISSCSNGCNDTTSAGLYTWDYPNNITFASGTVIADGDVYVVHHGSASSDIVAQGDQTFTYLSNGDDVMALTVAGATDSVFTIIDIIGEMGPDPGSGWDVAGVTNGTKDHTLVRKSSVRGGNTSWASSAGTNATDSEWTVEAKDTWTFVGSHTMLNLNQYFIKVTGASSTTVGAYLLTSSSTGLPFAYGKVVINEINYNAVESGTDTTEFIELYNHSASAVDLSGVKENNAIVFTFPAGASIAAGGYIVLAYDSTKFHNRYGSAPDYEWTSGALSNSGEDIELVDSSGARIDYVDFEDGSSASEQAAGWNAATDQGGPTYELIDPTSDNSLGTSWRGWGVSGGTPGAANSAQPDLSMGASITSYVASGTSSSSTFQLNNNGDSDLTVSSVTVDSTLVPGTTTVTLTSENFETGFGTFTDQSSGDWAVSTTLYNGGAQSIGDAYSSSASDIVEMTSAVDLTGIPNAVLAFSHIAKTEGGYDKCYVQISTDGGTTYSSLASGTYQGSGSGYGSVGYFDEDDYSTWGTSSTTPSNTWWKQESFDLSSYAGQSVKIRFKLTSDSSIQRAGWFIDDVTIKHTPGTYVVTSWLSATAPSAIAAGDSGNITLTFNASSFSSDTSLSKTINVFNNDPQDSAKTFTATMNVRADTAILDITSGSGGWLFGGTTVGDTLSGTATITIQNDGGTNLVVDSLRFAVGTNWYSNLTDSAVVAPNATSSFKVYYNPQAYGVHRDTLRFSINSDSTSGETVSMAGYAYTASDTVFSSGTLEGWTHSNYYGSTSSNYGYFTNTWSGTAHIISPQMVLDTNDAMIIQGRNSSSTVDQYLVIYFSDDVNATKFTGWTILDSILVPKGGGQYGHIFLSRLKSNGC